MKVSNVGSGRSSSSTGRTRHRGAADGGSFASELTGTEKSKAASAPVESQNVGAVGSILAVQQVPDSLESESRGRARQYGDDLLDRLEELRRDLLLGVVAKDRLAGLAHTLRAQRVESEDARLNAIIDEIELRARVEIAKLTREGWRNEPGRWPD